MKKDISTKKEDKRINIKRIAFIISGIVIVLTLILISSLINKTSITYKIAESMTESKNVLLSKNTILKEEGGDTKYKYSYTECTHIYKDKEDDENRIVTIALYDSNDQAKHKINFINKLVEYTKEKYGDTIINEVYTDNEDETIIIDNYILNISEKYIDQKDEIIKIFKKNKKKYKYESESNVSTKGLDKYWNKEFENSKKDLKNMYTEKVEKLKEEISNDIYKMKKCTSVLECKNIYKSVEIYNKYNELSNSTKKLIDEYNKKVIKVIDFSQMSWENISNWCKERKIVCYKEEEYSDTVPNGGYIKQSELADTEVINNKSIIITYSKGRKPTQSELNALNKAQSYSDHQYMSKNRLYRQLTSSYGEGFTAAEAQYAIEHVKADWNYNALQTGKHYYTRQNMSKSRVYQQLVSPYGEDFTPEQAQYAVDHLDD